MSQTNEFTVTPVNWAEAGEILRRIREEVFMQEQGVPAELEWDGLDVEASHILARDAAGEPIGTARLLPDGSIGRMAVVRRWRCRGVGHAMLTALLEAAVELDMAQVRLNAQIHALAFYQNHGFVAEGEEFLDAGILHRRMVCTL